MLGIGTKQSNFRCPHCGHEQTESTHLISTYCRACGQHYSVEKALNSAEQGRISEGKEAIATRALRCYRCGQHQQVSVHAQVTLCSQCNASISLVDVVVAKPTSQEVDTRGQLTIFPEGYLGGRLSICGSALIEGKVSGILFCEQTARLSGKGRSSMRLTAKRIVVEQEADLCFHFPLHMEELIVYGQLTGVILCTGTVRIHRYGVLDGSVQAHSIEVTEKGSYLGDLHINHGKQKEPSLPHFEKFPQLKPKRKKRRILPGKSPI